MAQKFQPIYSDIMVIQGMVYYCFNHIIETDGGNGCPIHDFSTAKGSQLKSRSTAPTKSRPRGAWKGMLSPRKIWEIMGFQKQKWDMIGLQNRVLYIYLFICVCIYIQICIHKYCKHSPVVAVDVYVILKHIIISVRVL